MTYTKLKTAKCSENNQHKKSDRQTWDKKCNYIWMRVNETGTWHRNQTCGTVEKKNVLNVLER
jgi:hypothetical protein